MPGSRNGSQPDSLGVSTTRASGGIHYRHQAAGTSAGYFWGWSAGLSEFKAMVGPPWRSKPATHQHVRHHRDNRPCDLPDHQGGGPKFGASQSDRCAHPGPRTLRSWSPSQSCAGWRTGGAVCRRGGSSARLSESRRAHLGAICRSSLRWWQRQEAVQVRGSCSTSGRWGHRVFGPHR